MCRGELFRVTSVAFIISCPLVNLCLLTVPSKIRKYSSVYVRNKEKKIKERKREFLGNQGPNVCC